MTRLPAIDFRTIDRVLRRLGFEAVRQKGSYVFFRHPDGRTTTAPNHPGRDLARPLREIELTTDQLARELGKRGGTA